MNRRHLITTTETGEVPKDVWKAFLKTHWKIALVAIGGIIGAVIGAIYVFLWRTIGVEAQAIYPATLDLWTVGFAIRLIIDLILWELLIVFVPVIVAVVALYLLWWKKLPADEQNVFKNAPRENTPKKKGRRRNGRGFFNVLVGITWLIIIAVNGKWDEAFRLWTFTFLINSIVGAFLWDLVILGIPAGIALIWWLKRELKR